MSVSTWRHALADRVAGAVGWPGFAAPPPSITPPCVVILPGQSYATGPRRTGCLVDASVTVRLVTDVHETDGAFDDLDDRLESALGVLAAFERVDVAARTYGESRWWCVDIVVTEPVPIPAPALAARNGSPS